MDVKSRIERTIIISVTWLAFIILFLAFNPVKLNITQNIAAVLCSGVIATGTIAITWIRIIGR